MTRPASDQPQVRSSTANPTSRGARPVAIGLPRVSGSCGSGQVRARLTSGSLGPVPGSVPILEGSVRGCWVGCASVIIRRCPAAPTKTGLEQETPCVRRLLSPIAVSTNSELSRSTGVGATIRPPTNCRRARFGFTFRPRFTSGNASTARSIKRVGPWIARGARLATGRPLDSRTQRPLSLR